MRIYAITALLCALLPAASLAQESVCLKTGFCLDVESHMIADGMLVVQNGKGTLQFPVDEVDGITALPAAAITVAAESSAGSAVSSPAAVSSMDFLIRAALQEGLEPEFVRSVAVIESGLRQETVSPKGAIGLMQLMPMTAGQLGVDPTRIEQNALGGAAFLRQLLIKYNGNSALALAAYNAGPGAVDKYKGVPPYPETRRYVVKVLQEYARQQRMQALEAAKRKPASSAYSSSSEALQAEAATLKAAGTERSSARP